jgi:hypothetical protein
MSGRVIAHHEEALWAALQAASAVPQHPLNQVDPNALLGPQVFSNVQVLRLGFASASLVSGYVQIEFVCDENIEKEYFYFWVPMADSGEKLVSPYGDLTVGSAQIWAQQYSIPGALDPSQRYGYEFGAVYFILDYRDDTMLIFSSATLFGVGSYLIGVTWQAFLADGRIIPGVPSLSDAQRFALGMRKNQ